MAYTWTDNEMLLQHKGIEIYHVYEDDMQDNPPRDYLYGLSAQDNEDGPDVFDVRELPRFGIHADEHCDIIKANIDRGNDIVIGWQEENYEGEMPAWVNPEESDEEENDNDPDID